MHARATAVGARGVTTLCAGFAVLIFPTNQFGNEPGSDGDSLRFVRGQGAEFPVFCSVRVNGGMCSNKGIDPFIMFLRESCPEKKCKDAGKIRGDYTKVRWRPLGTWVMRRGQPDWTSVAPSAAY